MVGGHRNLWETPEYVKKSDVLETNKVVYTTELRKVVS